MNEIQEDKLSNALLSVAIGDAIGVPYEFKSAQEMKSKPAKDMIGYGVHNQPMGTWSDDGALTFCLAESLTKGYDLLDIAKNFVLWKTQAYWSARNEVFDIGMTTSRSISRLEELLQSNDLEGLKLLKYDAQESDNGNGSLMRILPLLYLIKGWDIEKQFEVIWEVSALTHRHIRAAMACFIYLKYAELLLDGVERNDAYKSLQNEVKRLWNQLNFSQQEAKLFDRLIHNDISQLSQNEIHSGGYVLQSLEASFWSFLTTNSFEEAILKAVNLGHDTDTTGAITGGLAGIFYSRSDIPEFWLASLARLEDILTLAESLAKKYC
ncbi:MAG: ADP-ribosylglycohydrolase family protein [Bacteroidota bacterium]